MKTFKHLLFAVVASALLTVGLTKIAASFDTAPNHSQVQVADGGGSPGMSCIILS